MGTSEGEQNASDLGQFLGEYRNGRAFALKAWLLGPFVMSVGGVLLVAGLLDKNSDQAGPATMVFAIALCVGIIALGALLPIVWLRNLSLRVRLYERGLSRQVRGQEQRMRWVEVERYFRAGVSVSMHGIPVGTARQFTLENARGESIKLNQHLRDVLRLVAIIEKEVWAQLRPRLRQDFDAGRTVVFGPLQVGPAGIGRRDRWLAWGAFERYRVVAGVIQLFERGRSRPLFSAQYSQVPNAQLMLEELGRRAPR